MNCGFCGQPVGEGFYLQPVMEGVPVEPKLGERPPVYEQRLARVELYCTECRAHLGVHAREPELHHGKLDALRWARRLVERWSKEGV